VRFSLERNDFGGTAMTKYVKQGESLIVAWPLQNGWYDVTVTANTGTGFSYRFAGPV
jgi:phospholipase C